MSEKEAAGRAAKEATEVTEVLETEVRQAAVLKETTQVHSLVCSSATQFRLEQVQGQERGVWVAQQGSERHKFRDK